MNQTLRALSYFVLLGLTILALAGCRGREVIRAPSPTGSLTALVLSLPSLDPPRQVIVLEDATRARTELARVPPDSEWVDEVAWSADGQRVGFLLSGRHFLAFDTEPLRKVADLDLLDGAPRGRVAHQAREVILAPAGDRVGFVLCSNENPADCGERRWVAF